MTMPFLFFAVAESREPRAEGREPRADYLVSMTSSPLPRLFAHNAWADARVIESLRSAQRDGRLPDRALALFAHVLGAEAVWLARIEGRASEIAVWPTLTVDECETVAHSVHSALQALAVASDAPSRMVHYRNSAGDEFDSTLEDILVHVAMHGSYHRGQVAMLLRDAGAVPSPTDFIAFARGAPAATRRG